ncbi:MAG: polyprenyl synthetase family protein, partial [bacterium]
IKDDILGIWGSEDMGKSTESDLKKKKKTLPVVFALEKMGGSDRINLLDFYSNEKPSHKEIVAIKEVLERAGAKEYSENMAAEYYSRALNELDKSRLENSAIKSLKRAASLVIKRDF